MCTAAYKKKQPCRSISWPAYWGLVFCCWRNTGRRLCDRSRRCIHSSTSAHTSASAPLNPPLSIRLRFSDWNIHPQVYPPQVRQLTNKKPCKVGFSLTVGRSQNYAWPTPQHTRHNTPPPSFSHMNTRYSDPLRNQGRVRSGNADIQYSLSNLPWVLQGCAFVERKGGLVLLRHDPANQTRC